MLVPEEVLVCGRCYACAGQLKRVSEICAAAAAHFLFVHVIHRIFILQHSLLAVCRIASPCCAPTCPTGVCAPVNFSATHPESSKERCTQVAGGRAFGQMHQGTACMHLSL